MIASMHKVRQEEAASIHNTFTMFFSKNSKVYQPEWACEILKVEYKERHLFLVKLGGTKEYTLGPESSD